MSETDKSETIKINECPYCDGKVIDDECQNCGWRPCYEDPLDDSWEGRFGEE
jgi:hypothetical protein